MELKSKERQIYLLLPFNIRDHCAPAFKLKLTPAVPQFSGLQSWPGTWASGPQVLKPSKLEGITPLALPVLQLTGGHIVGTSWSLEPCEPIPICPLMHIYIYPIAFVYLEKDD